MISNPFNRGREGRKEKRGGEGRGIAEKPNHVVTIFFIYRENSIVT